MGNLRRYYVTDAPVFITAVCHQRQATLKSDAAKNLLLAVMREVKQVIQFRMLGYVILDDHFHWIILPPRAGDFSRIMQSVKLRFTRRFDGAARRVWQPRFWDHIIRDGDDLARHLDYIHYNPVKHGYAGSPAYEWSSFESYVKRGHYPSGWGNDMPPATTNNMELE